MNDLNGLHLGDGFARQRDPRVQPKGKPLAVAGFGWPRAGSIQGPMDLFRSEYYQKAGPQLGLSTHPAQQVQQPAQTQEIQAPRDLPQTGQQAPVQIAQPAFGPRATELGNLRIALDSVFNRPGRDVPYQPTPGPSGLKEFGGAYGQVAGERQLMNPAALQGYQPVYEPQTPTGQQVSDPRSYNEAMSIFNPDGRFYQGALPSQVAAPGGGTRAGFLGPQPLPVEQTGVDRGADALSALGYERGSRGQFFRSAGNMPAGQAQAMARANEMLRSPERAAYIDKRKSDLASRRALVKEKAQEVGQARRDRIAARKYVPSFEDRLAAANPGAYQGRKAMEARMNGEQIDSQNRIALADRQIAARKQESDERNQTLLDAERIRQGIQLDSQGQQAAALPDTPPESSQYANMSPAERAMYLSKLPQATRDRIEDEISRRGFWSRLFTGDLNQPGQGDAVSKAAAAGNQSMFGILGSSGALGPAVKAGVPGRAIGAMINVPRLVNPRAGAFKLEDLQDQPGDTARQKRDKAYLRAKYGKR